MGLFQAKLNKLEALMILIQLEVELCAVMVRERETASRKCCKALPFFNFNRYLPTHLCSSHASRVLHNLDRRDSLAVV